MKARLLAAARRDLRNIEHWYRSRAPGVDASFRAAFEIVFRRIERHPLGHPMVHGSFRRALLARFPYAVYFVVTARGVWIVAVQHLARDPRSVWRRAP